MRRAWGSLFATADRERSNGDGDDEYEHDDGGRGGVIMPPSSPSATLDDFEDDNDDDDDNGDIYDDGDDDNVPDHNYHVEDGSLAGTGIGEGESSTRDGRSDGRISEGGGCGTHDDGDDDGDIDESDELPSGRPDGAATGPSPGRLAANCPPEINAGGFRDGNASMPSPPHPPRAGDHEGSDGPSVSAVENIGGSEFADKCDGGDTGCIDATVDMDARVSTMEDARSEGDVGNRDITVDRFDPPPSVGNGGDDDIMAGPGSLAYVSPRGGKYEEDDYRGARESGDTGQRTIVGEEKIWDGERGCRGAHCHETEDATGGKDDVSVDIGLSDRSEGGIRSVDSQVGGSGGTILGGDESKRPNDNFEEREGGGGLGVPPLGLLGQRQRERQRRGRRK